MTIRRSFRPRTLKIESLDARRLLTASGEQFSIVDSPQGYGDSVLAAIDLVQETSDGQCAELDDTPAVVQVAESSFEQFDPPNTIDLQFVDDAVELIPMTGVVLSESGQAICQDSLSSGGFDTSVLPGLEADSLGSVETDQALDVDRFGVALKTSFIQPGSSSVDEVDLFSALNLKTTIHSNEGMSSSTAKEDSKKSMVDDYMAASQQDSAWTFESRDILLATLERMGVFRTDINGDGITSPLDFLIVINALHRLGVGSPVPTASSGLLDVNADGMISPLDALVVLNVLNRLDQKAFEETSNVMGPLLMELRAFATSTTHSSILDGLESRLSSISMARSVISDETGIERGSLNAMGSEMSLPESSQLSAADDRVFTISEDWLEAEDALELLAAEITQQ